MRSDAFNAELMGGVSSENRSELLAAPKLIHSSERALRLRVVAGSQRALLFTSSSSLLPRVYGASSGCTDAQHAHGCEADAKRRVAA